MDNWALVSGGVVQNIVVADQSFIDTVSSNYDYCVNLNGVSPSPSVGWSYDGDVFTAPSGPNADEVADAIIACASAIESMITSVRQASSADLSSGIEMSQSTAESILNLESADAWSALMAVITPA